MTTSLPSLPSLPQHLDPVPDLPSLARALTHSRGEEEISTRCQGACIQGGSWLDGITDLMDVNLSKLPGVGDGQGGLVCCSLWGRRVGHDGATN